MYMKMAMTRWAHHYLKYDPSVCLAALTSQSPFVGTCITSLGPREHLVSEVGLALSP